MAHARAMATITNLTANSYRRLALYYETPVYISWSRRNRSANIRVPSYEKGQKTAARKRLENRTPDPSSNPYLGFAAMTAAGLDGIKKETRPRRRKHPPPHSREKTRTQDTGATRLIKRSRKEPQKQSCLPKEHLPTKHNRLHNRKRHKRTQPNSTKNTPLRIPTILRYLNKKGYCKSAGCRTA
ncbi:MAG: hypothetical protein M1503_11205 [Thaumarchaeota archaeon]|nr:hypothetical protein [Nitrososphaerota archaeon]